MHDYLTATDTVTYQNTIIVSYPDILGIHDVSLITDLLCYPRWPQNEV